MWPSWTLDLVHPETSGCLQGSPVRKCARKLLASSHSCFNKWVQQVDKQNHRCAVGLGVGGWGFGGRGFGGDGGLFGGVLLELLACLLSTKEACFKP